MNIIESLEAAKTNIFSYSSGFRYLGLIIGALLYLWRTKQALIVKKMVHIAVLFFVLFFFPPFMWWVCGDIGKENCGKLILGIPVIFIVAYAVTHYYYSLEEKRVKGAWIAFCGLALVLAGYFPYIDEEELLVYRVEDRYGVSGEKRMIAETLLLEPEDMLLLADDKDILVAIRRMDGGRNVLYGIDIEHGGYGQEEQEIYEMMNEENVPIGKVLENAKSCAVSHIILYKWKEYEPTIGELADNGILKMLGETENYWSFRIERGK